MPSCSKSSIEIRRARPLLGTLVDIRATAPTTALAERAVRAAFAALDRVQALMSFHEPTSNVSQLNRQAAQHAVCVDGWTHQVLRRAKKMHAVSGGLFEITVAAALIRHGWLPRGATPRAAAAGCTTDLTLLPGNRVRFRQPLLIDLGGIAKGFAVDRAIAALRRHGATAGAVNAGGDLRVFGSLRAPVHVRRPESPGEFQLLTSVQNSALATSAPYYAARMISGHACVPIIDPRNGRPSRQSDSVTVQARTCVLADALCKIVWLAGADVAAPILRRYRATAWLLASNRSATQSTPARHAA